MTCSVKYQAIISGDSEGMVVYWDNKTSHMKKFPNYPAGGIQSGDIKSVIQVIL